MVDRVIDWLFGVLDAAICRTVKWFCRVAEGELDP